MTVTFDPQQYKITTRAQWGPARHEEAILYADIDPAAVRAARRYFDPVGHYHRPDIFQLRVDTRPRPSVVLQEPPSDLSEISLRIVKLGYDKLAPPMPASLARMMAPDGSATCSLVMMFET